MTDPTRQTTPTRDEAGLDDAALEAAMNTLGMPDLETYRRIVRTAIKAYVEAAPTTSCCKGLAPAWECRCASAPAPASGRVDAGVNLAAAVETYLSHTYHADLDEALDTFRALSPATPVSEAGGEPITARYTNWQGVTAERTFIPHRVFFGSNEWHPEPQVLIEATDCEKGALRTFAAAGFSPVPEFTYSSTQATKCAGCGEHKHTPLRRDEMGGYVCLTCIDKALAKPASSPAGGGVDEAAINVAVSAMEDDLFIDDIWLQGTSQNSDRLRHYATIALASQSTSAGRVGE